MLKRIQSNYHVKVFPRDAGDFGMIKISSNGFQHSKEEEISICEKIADQIRKHVDKYEFDRGEVMVDFDVEDECEYCGMKWTELSSDYNGGCCEQDEENNPDAREN